MARSRSNPGLLQQVLGRSHAIPGIGTGSNSTPSFLKNPLDFRATAQYKAGDLKPTDYQSIVDQALKTTPESNPFYAQIYQEDLNVQKAIESANRQTQLLDFANQVKTNQATDQQAVDFYTRVGAEALAKGDQVNAQKAQDLLTAARDNILRNDYNSFLVKYQTPGQPLDQQLIGLTGLQQRAFEIGDTAMAMSIDTKMNTVTGEIQKGRDTFMGQSQASAQAAATKQVRGIVQDDLAQLKQFQDAYKNGTPLVDDTGKILNPAVTGAEVDAATMHIYAHLLSVSNTLESQGFDTSKIAVAGGVRLDDRASLQQKLTDAHDSMQARGFDLGPDGKMVPIGTASKYDVIQKDGTVKTETISDIQQRPDLVPADKGMLAQVSGLPVTYTYDEKTGMYKITDSNGNPTGSAAITGSQLQGILAASQGATIRAFSGANTPADANKLVTNPKPLNGSSITIEHAPGVTFRTNSGREVTYFKQANGKYTTPETGNFEYDRPIRNVDVTDRNAKLEPGQVMVDPTSGYILGYGGAPVLGPQAPTPQAAPAPSQGFQMPQLNIPPPLQFGAYTPPANTINPFPQPAPLNLPPMPSLVLPTFNAPPPPAPPIPTANALKLPTNTPGFAQQATTFGAIPAQGSFGTGGLMSNSSSQGSSLDFGSFLKGLGTGIKGLFGGS